MAALRSLDGVPEIPLWVETGRPQSLQVHTVSRPLRAESSRPTHQVQTQVTSPHPNPPVRLGAATRRSSTACGAWGWRQTSVTALLRMRALSLIVSAGAVPSTWPAAVEIDPPLLTLNTSALPLLRTRSSAPRLAATQTRCSSARQPAQPSGELVVAGTWRPVCRIALADGKLRAWV